jgi:hypothetical protein
MYENVYENMVECGVAIKLEEEAMFDKYGNGTLDKKEMVGRPSKYKLTKPEHCMFVNETGCNTNMKLDGFIGGQLHITSVEQSEGGKTEVTNDIHFTALTFIVATGDVVMCSIILKSE